MGRERAVIAWEVRHQLLTDEIARIEQKLARAQGAEATASPFLDAATTADLQANLLDLRAQLRALGPSPKARMG